MLPTAATASAVRRRWIRKRIITSLGETRTGTSRRASLALAARLACKMHAQHETILLLHFKIIQCWMGRSRSIRRATHDRRTTKNVFLGGVLVTDAAQLL